MPHPVKGYKIDGKQVYGTTTIIGRFKDSGALLYWACEQGKAIERGEINKLYDRRDEAATAGTLAQSLVEAHINMDAFPDLSNYPIDIANKARQGFENYLQWERDNRIKITHQEIVLISREYMFGGCPDAIGIDSQGRTVILDWKTSNGVYPDYLVQLAAYRQLWDENNPKNPITGGFHLLRFSKENADFTHYYWSELDDAWEQFKLFRRAYDIDKLLKRRV